MSRPLMHPLRESGSLTKVNPGHWEHVQRADQLTEIPRGEHVDRTKRPGISSIPSPWARMQLFRDAVADPDHPAHDDVMNDLLDGIEVILFQRALANVHLTVRTVNLEQLERSARAERKTGVENFVQTLRELALEVQHRIPLEALTLIFNNDQLILATSPFTLLFTPEQVRGAVPGYFTRNRPMRSLAQRPPALAEYIKHDLLPQLAQGGGTGELMHLHSVLRKQLESLDVSSERRWHPVDAGIHPSAQLRLHRIDEVSIDSLLTLKPTRESQEVRRLPLVIDNSSSPEQRRYFPWLERPASAVVDPGMPRDVLPGTSWKLEWISPEFDFLSEKLIVLDSALYSDRVHGPASGAGELGNRILLPLTPKFFEFFRAEDVPSLVTMRIQGGDHELHATVQLRIPTHGRDVLVERHYRAPRRVGAAFSVWPSFVTTEAPVWHDYYLVTHVEGDDVSDALDVEVYADGVRLKLEQYQRDVSTLVQHFDRPPECVFVRERTRAIGDDRLGAGVILPKLKPAPHPAQDPWTVAIDFGTSNTVVAYAEGTQKGTLESSIGTRLDLTRTSDVANHVANALDSFFFPSKLDGRPFGTVMFRNRNADSTARHAHLPALTANVPFTGQVTSGVGVPGSRFANEIVGDLKWDGGGTDGERLTKLFLHQVLQVVYAEARFRGVRTRGMSVRWSYPSAFSIRKQSAMQNRWSALISEFERERMRLIPSSGDDGPSAEGMRDESLAALLYLRTDPAARGNFATEATYMKLTADVGGGTTDVAGYANNRILFRNSILFGGRDLIGDEGGEPVGGLFGQIHAWARTRNMPQVLGKVLDAYPTAHTKFTYLVRHPWFAEQRGALATEDWFLNAQCSILYFFSAIHYNVGLSLRGRIAGDVKAPDYLFFGGNGSGYLNWLAGFEPWNRSRARAPFTTFLGRMMEEGLGMPLGHEFTVLTSSKPKHEVALGLLEDAPHIIATDVAKQPPVGEEVMLDTGTPTTSAPHEALMSASLRDAGIPAFRYAKPFDDREIAKFNRVFVSAMSLLTQVDDQWSDVAKRAQRVLSGLDDRFFDAQVRGALTQHLDRDDIGAVTLFILEATSTLRELDRRLNGQ